MKSNNPFKIHNINHLSASKINSWVNDPSLFILGLCGLKQTVGAGAWRGTAVEFGVYKKLSDKRLSHKTIKNLYVGKFESEQIENSMIDSPKILKEKDNLDNYYNNAISLYETFGQIEEYQKKIWINFDDIEVPFLGYIDFVFKDYIRDTKTTARMPSKVTSNHERQLSLYSKAYPNKDVWVDYITPKETTSYKITNIKNRLQEIENIVFGMRKFLSISNDIEELASILYPNYDNWTWNDDMIKQAKTIRNDRSEK